MNKFREVLLKKNFLIHENASENIVCETAAIMSRGWSINSRYKDKTVSRLP